MKPGRHILLGSTSETRRRLLAAAGVDFQAVASGVDEDGVKSEFRSSSTDREALASRLAEAKALAVANQHPDAVVIGADQVLWIDGEAFDKPASSDAARQQLLRLRGRTHTLHTAVACASGSELIWFHAESPQLTMRAFSLDYLDHYLAREGSAVTETVGGYKVEGRGIQLFDRICGDYFAVLGLPLLPLLDFLRTQRLIDA